MLTTYYFQIIILLKKALPGIDKLNPRQLYCLLVYTHLQQKLILMLTLEPCHRLPSEGNNKIIVKFSRRKDIELVLRSRKNKNF